MVDSASGELDAAVPTTADMSQVTATSPLAVPPATGDLVLSNYLTGLEGTLVKTDCTYEFLIDGTVIQTVP